MFIRNALGFAIGITILGWGAAAAEPMKEKPGVVDAVAATVTAKVESIDYKTRTVTLKGPDGTLETIHAGPEITRFEEVKKGDEVTIEYLESVAIVVQPPDKTVASAEGSKSMIVRNKGKKPSGTLVETDVVSATVEKIDAKKRTATLLIPGGEKMHIDIAPDVEHLENVKKGDQVLVKHTRSIALEIRQPTKK